MNLVLSRHGIWYSRYTYLLPSGKRKEIRKSLRTRCKRTANKLIQASSLTPVIAIPNGSPNYSPDSLCTPLAPPLSSCETVLKLGDAVQLWMDERTREGLSKAELKRVKTYMKSLVSIVGNKRVDVIGRREANLFKDALTASDKSITTINNYLKRARALYCWLATRIDDLRNPFDGLTVKQNKAPSEQRRAFTPDEFKRLKDASETLPAYKRMIILIACFTGMRQNEICQLYKGDIKRVKGIWCIDVTDVRPDQRLKTSSSRRVIPIASTLLEQGIIDLTEGSRDERVFPELSGGEEQGYARHFTRWFGRWRRRNELPEFHSIRHTVATKLKSEGVAEQYAAQLLGHTTGSMTYSRYGKGVEIMRLVPLVEVLGDAV